MFRHAPDEESAGEAVSRLTWLLLDFVRLSDADAGPAAFEVRKAALLALHNRATRRSTNT